LAKSGWLEAIKTRHGPLRLAVVIRMRASLHRPNRYSFDINLPSLAEHVIPQPFSKGSIFKAQKGDSVITLLLEGPVRLFYWRIKPI
jgi:hypothetical protein